MDISFRSTTATRLRSAGNTDRGRLRHNNEDSFLVDDQHLLYAVADGLGGLPGGSVASRVAIRELEERFPPFLAGAHIDFPGLLQAVNERVQQEGHRIDPYGIGTTLTAAHIEGSTLRWGHVGDSGLILYRDEKARTLTREHTMLEALKQRRNEPLTDVPEHFAHTLTRCIGQFGEVEVDTGEETLEPGDRLILATDGITKVMSLEEIEQAVLDADSPDELVTHLIEMADSRGGIDNATATVVFVESV